ncbi:hypothetical protein [Streptomyces collinus]
MRSTAAPSILVSTASPGGSGSGSRGDGVSRTALVYGAARLLDAQREPHG